MTSNGNPLSRGAYGLTLPDLRAEQLLVPAPAEWSTWHIRHRPAGPAERADLQTIHPDRMHLKLPAGIWVEMDRLRSTTTLVLPARPSDEAIVHPYLGSTASVHARWRGWNCFHAGGVAINGGAWGILGTGGAGKSSSLAGLTLTTEAEIVCDDALVIDTGGQAYAGPRCIDLRRDPARHFGVGDFLPNVGIRERWRLRLPDIAPTTPFRGWVELAWGDNVALDPLTPSELLPILMRNQSLPLAPPDLGRMLNLLALPAYRLSRPPGIEKIGEATKALVEKLAAEPVT